MRAQDGPARAVGGMESGGNLGGWETGRAVKNKVRHPFPGESPGWMGPGATTESWGE